MKKWIKRIFIGTAVLFLIIILGLGYVIHLLTDRVEGKYFDSDGVNIHYTVDGDGEETVILVHGLAAQADVNWRLPGITDLLSKEYTVVMFDLRGHGLSDKPVEPESYGDELMRDIPRLMDHLEIEKAHIAGYSLGGFITLKMAVEYPERILSAAYCASGWKDPEDPADVRSPYRSPDYPDTYKDTEVREKIEELHEQRMQHSQSASVLDFSFRTLRSNIKDYVGDQFMTKPVRKALKASYVELIVTADDLNTNTIPSICFIGSKDGLRSYAEDMKKNTPELDLVLLDGADHITTVLNSNFQIGLLDFFKKN